MGTWSDWGNLMNSNSDNKEEVKMAEKFRPSNSTEGELFERYNCNQCEKEENCDVFNNAFCDEDVEEWTAEDVLRPETWKCSAKKEIPK